MMMYILLFLFVFFVLFVDSCFSRDKPTLVTP